MNMMRCSRSGALDHSIKKGKPLHWLFIYWWVAVKKYLWSIVWFLCIEKNLKLPYSVSGSLAMSAMAISTNFYFWESSASVVHQRVPMKGSNYFLSWGQVRRSLATWQWQPRPKSFKVMWPMDHSTLHYYHAHNNIHIGIEIFLSRL